MDDKRNTLVAYMDVKATTFFPCKILKVYAEFGEPCINEPRTFISLPSTDFRLEQGTISAALALSSSHELFIDCEGVRSTVILSMVF